MVYEAVEDLANTREYGRLARGHLAVECPIGIDARLNERLLAHQRTERQVQWRAEIPVEFVLRLWVQTMRGEGTVDATCERHPGVDEHAVEIEQHSVVVSHLADHDGES